MVSQELEITLKVPLSFVNVALNSMHQQPYVTVAPVIKAFETQAQAQIDAKELEGDAK